MPGSLPVDADIAIAAYRRRGNEVPLDAGSSWRQGEQGIYTAAVGCQIRDLLSGDDVADLPGVGLHLHALGFHGYALLRRPHLQAQINTRPIADVQYNSGSLRLREARRLGFHVVVADHQTGSGELSVVV